MQVSKFLLVACALLACWQFAGAEVILVQGEARKPYPGIQAALDAALPGDVVEVGGGTYHENVRFPRSGQAGKPITLAGKTGEHAIIDGADPGLQVANNGRWQAFDYNGKKFYKTEVPFASEFPGLAIGTWVSYHGVEGQYGSDKLIASYASLEGLDKAPRGEGSFRKGETVTVHLENDADPNTLPLNIGTAEAVVETGGQSHVVIRNIEIRNGGWSGIEVGLDKKNEEMAGMTEFDAAAAASSHATQDIDIKDVTIRNCFRGIATDSAGIRDLRIHRAIIANGVRDGWLWRPGYQKGIGAAVGNSSDALAPMRGFGMRLTNVDGGEVSESVIAGQWDGIGLKKCHHLQIHHNTIYGMMDDGIEFESANQGEVQFYNNHIYDVCTGLSVTSNFPGPIYIYRNVVEVTHPGGPKMRPTFSIKSGHDSLGRAENIKFYNNTFYGMSLNLWEKTRDEAPDEWKGYDFVNNIFFTENTRNYSFRGLGEHESGPGNHWEGNAYNASQPQEAVALYLPELRKQFVGADTSSRTIPRDLRLQPDSAAKNTGSEYAKQQGWPDSIQSYPDGRDRGAWEDGMKPDDIGAPADLQP